MKDFQGFRFGQVHSEKLHLVVVSVNDRYDKNILPENNDYSTEVPGGNGAYYFGSTFNTREFTVSVAFDKVDEITWRRISNLFATDKPQDLVFDELPYKTYRAKIKSKPEFKYICFTNRDTGERVYKGEGTLVFVCYQPFAYGFNKYIVRAADSYLTELPTNLPNYDDRLENPYRKKVQKIPNLDTKEYYNVEKNMGVPWKDGYPTIEQVRAGELYFNAPDGTKQLIDVRGYFRNVPEWAKSSRLLTTPTLDYDQDLIFLPQYCKDNYINMDTGFNDANALIGSRLLVYNPGDLPVDFEIKFDNNERTFWSERGEHFQVRRFNVQRLPIPMAVDLTGLQPYPDGQKYGKKYFKVASVKETVIEDDFQYNTVEDLDLNEQHPDHTFIVEPIPKERLGHYIKLFYWQSSQLYPDFDFEEGVELANRYEELYKLCITDYERYELYWHTLKDAILDKYKDNLLFEYSDADYNKFVYDFIHNPPEFIRRNPSLNYGEVDFNISMMPQWITDDYFDITTEDIEKATLFLDSDKRMLYNISNPKWEKNDEITASNFYNYKPSKKIYNDNLKQGKWFKLPPGWSLIEVTPVCDEDNWGGKRWLDARPFDWGYGGNKNGSMKKIQKVYDKVFEMAAQDFEKETGIKPEEIRHKYDNRLIENKNFKLAYEYYKTQEIQLEYNLLRKIHKYWRMQKGITIDRNQVIQGSIQEWWWMASNYLWENFPPLYWGYADILNKAQIKYTPLFY